MSNATVVSVCISHANGLPRPEVTEGTLREGVGFVGNRHSVGGDREVCLYDIETYEALQADGMKVGPGSFGENLVTSGIPFGEIGVGSQLKVGEDAILEITMVRKPCSNLTQLDERLPQAIVGRSGWLARVVHGGVVRPGDAIELV